MHLKTVVKVWADSADNAIGLVKGLIENDYRYFPPPFDWYDEDAIKVAALGAAEFEALRTQEVEKYHYHMGEAEKLPITDTMKGYHLQRAGESLQYDEFWSTTRYAYELESEGANVYYIDTDRHY